jgi:hypothetical protein
MVRVPEPNQDQSPNPTALAKVKLGGCSGFVENAWTQ